MKSAPEGALKIRQDRSFREAAGRLRRRGWCAIVAYGVEAGAWLKVAVTDDVDGTAKVGQAHHPAEYCARAVAWAPTRLMLEHLRDLLLERAREDGLLLRPSCVAMTVAGYGLALRTAAEAAGVELVAPEDWEQLVEQEARR